jgi:hypothetical protein
VLDIIDDDAVAAALAKGGAYTYALRIREHTGVTLQQTSQV